MTAYCAWCGEKFEKIRPQTKYCCDDCRRQGHLHKERIAQKARYKPKGRTRTVQCKVCGKSFTGHHNAKYCDGCCPKRYFSWRIYTEGGCIF